LQANIGEGWKSASIRITESVDTTRTDRDEVGIMLDLAISRRGLIQGAAIVGSAVALTRSGLAKPLDRIRKSNAAGAVVGRLTGAQAVAESLVQEGVGCVFGIPGAQENELWDEFKARGVPYLLVTHEFSAAAMADGYARSTGQVGVLCVVPGPGITNALTGLGEALLDSVPLVAIVGDVGHGDHGRPFQVHSLPNADLLRPACKCVYVVTKLSEIPGTIRQAFRDAVSGEPGPVAVTVPYNLFIEAMDYNCPPPAEPALPFDQAAVQKAISLLIQAKRIGIYAGFGCMDHRDGLTAVAECLQAPVATSVSGKGAIDECHPLAVGWGFGPHASKVAEAIFDRDPMRPIHSGIDTLLAIGVKFSEVSTGYYGNPRPKHVIHVDGNPAVLGKVMPADVCVTADAGLFFAQVLASGIRKPNDKLLIERIAKAKSLHTKDLAAIPAGKCGVDPLAVVAALQSCMPSDGILMTDVSASEHLAAEYYTVRATRSYFNPVDNQSMGWSIPAAIGAQRAFTHRTVATLTGDGCFLMSAMELSTAAREGLPVKVIVLDDHAYHYMQMLQEPAFKRTTATRLAAIDYCAFAKAVGVGYVEILHAAQLCDQLKTAFATPGPVLVRVQTDYGNRKIRWIEAVRKRFTKELSAQQKVRFVARIGQRALNMKPEIND
jgi:acetolactate synthase I/II/III large subunit